MSSTSSTSRSRARSFGVRSSLAATFATSVTVEGSDLLASHASSAFLSLARSAAVTASRAGMRRFTRLTNAFSKMLENLTAAVSLHFMFYNFARPHMTLTKSANSVRTNARDGGRRC